MTKNEIKEQYSMREIVERYGFHPNRSGFISCPFHTGDRTPSLKIYSDSFFCFSCGTNGDIFDFVMRMDGVTFKGAFQSLGGVYEKPSFSSALAIYQAKKRREMKRKEEQREERARELNQILISVYRKYLERFPPLSDGWCDCYNRLQMELYRHLQINGGRRQVTTWSR